MTRTIPMRNGIFLAPFHPLDQDPTEALHRDLELVENLDRLGYEEALKLCAEESAKLLVDEWSFTPEDAFIFLSVACDAGVAQACKPAPGFGTIARFTIPKLDATPAPFRAP